jgi:AmmeMemoRadiSam system protein A
VAVSDKLLNDKESAFLLQLAREVITKTSIDETLQIPEYYSDTLSSKLGVFVTLHKKGELRGCIGYVEGVRPLQDAVIEMAQSAAFNDPRFAPVSSDEVDELELEISVLSPVEEVKNVDEIEIGKHGLIVEQGFFKGLLLPQVATENHWDRKEFLQHTCRKAGLPIDAWEEKNTKIYFFSAEIFSEK